MTESQYSSIIWLTQNKYTIVDNEDWDELSQWKWFSCNGYAGRQIPMHRVVADTPSHLMVDHINGNKLDNRKSNLRNCTSSQNSMNKTTSQKRASKYKGTRPNKNKDKWIAKICVGRKQKHLGTFSTQEEAAAVYDAAAKKMFGEFLYKGQ